ncbi:MAG: hypothetical protein DRN81_02570 [Thermoproteota archaeon]|nr:MAG: hypothetical protein DRN81_02570 [Candidatus Korarchaeota archaeon]
MGLKLEEIFNLTLTQITYFQKALFQKKIEELKAISYCIRVSAMGDENSFNSWIETLEDLIAKADYSVKGRKVLYKKQKRLLETTKDFEPTPSEKGGIQGSNRPESFFKNYFKNKKKTIQEI